MRTLVPVSLRRDDQRGDRHNLVSALFVSLDILSGGIERGMAELVALIA